MSRSGAPSGPTQVPAWVIRFNEAVERIYLVLRVSLVWLVLTLLGLIVLGIGPASCAAADALIAFRTNEKVRVLPVMWATYREELVRANVRMLPLMAVQVAAGVMAWIATSGLEQNPTSSAVMGTLAAASGGWATASLAAIAVAPRVRRQDLLVTWRLALLLPGALPLRSIALILGLIVWGVLCSVIWPLAVLLGAGAAIDLAVSLLSKRIAMLLEDIEKRSAAPA